MKQRYDQPFTFDRVVRLVISALAIGAGLYLLYILKNILLPFFIAWLFAYLLNPVVRFFKNKLRIGNGIAVVMTLLSVAGVIALLSVALVPLIEQEVWQINSLISNYEFTTISADGIPVNIADVINNYIDFKEIRASMSRDSMVEIIKQVSPAVEALFSNTISVLIGFTVIFLTFLYLIFIMLDYDKINALWQFMIPPKYRIVVRKVTLDVEQNMNTYFRHQALICVILAVLYAVGFQIIGLPMAIVFGIVVGMVHMIPYLQVVTFPVAILLCWLRASQTDAGFFAMLGLTALIYIIVQCIMDLFLVPRIMGKAMGLNPAIILLSLSVWGFFFGIVGMIIAIPLTTLLLSYYREFIVSSEKLYTESQNENMQQDGNCS